MSSDKSSGIGSTIDKGNNAVKSTVGALGDMGSTLMDAASSAFGATKSAASTAVGTAKTAAGQVSSTAAGVATDAYGKAKNAVVKGQEQSVRSLHDAQQLAAETKTRLETFAAEQPILVAALGVAFGAALGASLPITNAERTYIGDGSKKFAEKGTQVAKQVADSVTGTLAGSDVARKVGEVVDAAVPVMKSAIS